MTISGGRTEQRDIIAGFLPRHWLYEWFSQFHSCGTYSVFSRSPSIMDEHVLVHKDKSIGLCLRRLHKNGYPYWWHYKQFKASLSDDGGDYFVDFDTVPVLFLVPTRTVVVMLPVTVDQRSDLPPRPAQVWSDRADVQTGVKVLHNNLQKARTCWSCGASHEERHRRCKSTSHNCRMVEVFLHCAVWQNTCGSVML